MSTERRTCRIVHDTTYAPSSGHTRLDTEPRPTTYPPETLPALVETPGPVTFEIDAGCGDRVEVRSEHGERIVVEAFGGAGGPTVLRTRDDERILIDDRGEAVEKEEDCAARLERLGEAIRQVRQRVELDIRRRLKHLPAERRARTLYALPDDHPLRVQRERADALTRAWIALDEIASEKEIPPPSPDDALTLIRDVLDAHGEEEG